jgi:glutamate-1-semialdehyde 2,1-aminomutase
VTDWHSASKADTERFAAYFRAMLERGVYIAPSQFEAGFLSTEHGAEEIEATIAAASEAFAGLGRN